MAMLRDRGMAAGHMQHLEQSCVAAGLQIIKVCHALLCSHVSRFFSLSITPKEHSRVYSILYCTVHYDYCRGDVKYAGGCE